MEKLGELAQELGVVTFEQFMSVSRERRLNGSGWLKAKQAGLLNTFVQDGVLMVAPSGQTPAALRDVYPEREVR